MPDPHPDRLVASGALAGTDWMLRWGPFGPVGSLLRFHAGDAFGMLAPPSMDPVAFTVTEVEQHAVVWGLARHDAVAARVMGTEGEVWVAPAVGPDLDGHSAFLVVVPRGGEPANVECVDRNGVPLLGGALVPEPTGVADIAARIEVRVVDRDAGKALGTTVLEGTVDDARWEYSINVWNDEIHTRFQLRHPGGGGAGGDGGPAPEPGPGRRLGLGGCGSSGTFWHVTGWADPTVTEIVLHLRSGELLRVPTAGQQLDCAFVVFALALPGDASAVLADAHDALGDRLGRVHLAGRLSGMERSMEENRERQTRAAGPVPEVVHQLWRSTFASPLDEEDPDPAQGGRSRLLRTVLRPDVARHLPFRPILLPSARPADQERWVVFGKQRRAAYHHSVALGVVWFGGSGLPGAPDPDQWAPLLAEGAILLRQVVSWSKPEGQRDPPTTSVRGQRASLWEHTAARNGLDHLAFHWREPVTTGISAPVTGLWCSAEAHPDHHTADELRELVESLTAMP